MSVKLQNLLPGNPATVRAQSTKISADPKGEKIVYCQNRTVFIRSLTDPSKPALAYSQHTQPTTVARISPTGYYCASADQAGNVRVWDLVGDEQIIKNEVKVIAGRINDLSWDGESKRIIAVGEGRERFGHAFSFDSGSSVGEITGHSRQINAVAMRRDRPFRAVTAGDDNNLVFYHGAPYKFNKTISTHTRFVQDVAYAPNGDHFVSVGSDSKVFVYDGKSGDVLVDLSAKVAGAGHTGTIFAVDFSPDSKKIATAGADGFVKIWDLAAEKVEASYDFTGQGGRKADDQQVGLVWAAERIVSLSFSGELNVIVAGRASKLYGACKGFGPRALDVAEGGALVGGSFDGRVLTWSAEGVCKPVRGAGHSNAVLGVHSTRDGVVTVGMDDSVRKLADGEFVGAATALSGQPKGSAASASGTVVVAVPGGVDVVVAGKKSHQKTSYVPSAVAISADGTQVAVGAEDSKVYLYSISSSSSSGGGDSSSSLLTETAVFSNNRSTVTALAFDPQVSLLAAGESSGKIQVYDLASRTLKIAHWVFHSARINDIRFSPDGSHAVSAGLDTHVYIWSTRKPMKNIAVKNAHANGAQAVAWIDDSTFASAGADGAVKTWSVTRHDGA